MGDRTWYEQTRCEKSDGRKGDSPRASCSHLMNFLTDSIAKSSVVIRAVAVRLVEGSRSVLRSSLGKLRCYRIGLSRRPRM